MAEEGKGPETEESRPKDEPKEQPKAETREPSKGPPKASPQEIIASLFKERVQSTTRRSLKASSLFNSRALIRFKKTLEDRYKRARESKAGFALSDLSQKTAKRLGVAFEGLRLRQAMRDLVISVTRQAPQAITGIDIGAGAIKLVSLEELAHGKVVSSFDCLEIPLEAQKGRAKEFIREALVEFRKQGKIQPGVVLAFDDPDLAVHLARLPNVPASEVRQMIEWEVKENMAVALESYVLDYTILSAGEEPGKGLEALTVVAPKEKVLDWVGLVSDVGLRVEAVEPCALALLESVEGKRPWAPEETVGLLDMGMQGSIFSLARGENLYFSRRLTVGGDSITRSIADYCNMEYPEAEKYKRRFGLSILSFEEDRRVKEGEQNLEVKIAHALGLHLEQLVTEIEHSFRYFSFEIMGGAVEKMDRLYLAGGSSKLRNVDTFLKNRLKIPVHFLSPVELYPLAHPTLDQARYEEVGPFLSNSVGLALRGLS